MSQILNKFQKVDPNNSDAIKEVLVVFFQNLLKHTDFECLKWLHCLENAITRFPKYCMTHRNTIETYLAHFLETSNYNIVIKAAKCGHALQQVRPSQEKTATPKSSWRDQMNLLCNTAHSLIGALFPHSVDIYKHGLGQKETHSITSPLSSALCNLNSVQGNSQSNERAQISMKLRNVFVFLQAMLVEVYPVAKPVRPHTIFDVIMRALSVSSSSEPTISPIDVTLVKTEALRTVDALVTCLGSNLIPFSPLIFRFVMQTLKWSTENPSEESRKVRVSAYNSLANWLTVLHTYRTASDSRGRSWEDELTGHIIDDITPHRHVVQLTMSTQPTKQLSKKARKRLAKSMLQGSTIASHIPGEKNKINVSEETNDEVAIAALTCTETFFTVCGIFLKPTTHKRFQEHLVRECYNLNAYSSTRAIQLLRALDACRKGVSSSIPPPTQYCMQLYTTLVNNQCTEISKFCSQALLDIRLHLHCSPPSINFALEVQPERQNMKEDKKSKISERNRAALEALLGADKMPSKETQDIITIIDEPPNKRKRLEEDITDKISVSSESNHSIEISDESADEDSIVQEVEVVVEHVKNNKDVTNSGEEVDDEIDGNYAIEPTINYEKRSDNEEIIYNATTQIPENQCTNKELISVDEADSTQPEKVTIYEAITQAPLNVNNSDTIDEEESPVSMEIAYDYPNTGQEKVTVLEKLDDENLPSTNDTDDIQITCGQVVNYSQEITEKIVEDTEPKCEVAKVNGLNKSPQNVIQNGVPESLVSKDNSVNTKVTGSSDDVTVDDMMADFVDEVNDDKAQEC